MEYIHAEGTGVPHSNRVQFMPVVLVQGMSHYNEKHSTLWRGKALVR